MIRLPMPRPITILRLLVRTLGILMFLAALSLLLVAILSNIRFLFDTEGTSDYGHLGKLWHLSLDLWQIGVSWLGLTAWLIPPLMIMTALTLLLENGQGIWALRTASWALLIPATNLCLSSYIPDHLRSHYVGRLGIALYAYAITYIDSPWLKTLSTTAALAALVLATDRLFFKLSRFLIRLAGLLVNKNLSNTVGKFVSLRPLATNSPNKVIVPRKIEDVPIRVYTKTYREAESSEALANSIDHASQSAARTATKLPPLHLLDDPEPFPIELHEQKLRERAAKLEQTFADFGYHVRVVGINTGPVITQYEIALETGLRVNKVTCLADDLALNLKVPSVRILAPIPGKDTVGIEVPNEYRATVRMKEVIQAAGTLFSRMKIPLFLGKDTEGRPLVYDLADMPHLLIAGRTGTGKSVCMNAIILSILMTRRPDEVQMIMIDPKMLELSEYGNIPHLIHPVVKDVRKAEAILAWAVDKMEERYDLLSRARVRNIAAYNELSEHEIYSRLKPEDDEEKARIPKRMPYIVIFVDEMNDLMMTMRKEVEGHIIRLAQKSRAAGIHLVVATQKPTVDVITGLIKSNLPARICFQVSSRSDSRVVLDEIGAEKLLGKGDMLFLQPGTSTLIRAQGTYASDREITRVVEYLAQEPYFSRELIQLSNSAKRSKEQEHQTDNRRPDELYEQAVEIVIREQRGSVSLLQRVLGIGYGRAARLIDWMAEDGIVGSYNGSNARQVLIKPEEWNAIKAQRLSGTRLNKDI